MINFIQNNIHLLTKEHIRIFAKKNNISYTEDELQIVYNFILNNYQELLKGNINCLENIKNSISPTLYNNILNIYNKYKKEI